MANEYGTTNPVYDVLKYTVYGIPTSQNPSMVNGITGQADTTPLLLILPGYVEVSAEDVLVFNGTAYHVVGSPSSWQRLYRGKVCHLEIPLKTMPGMT